jgi:hypothetical protein
MYVSSCLEYQVCSITEERCLFVMSILIQAHQCYHITNENCKLKTTVKITRAGHALFFTRSSSRWRFRALFWALNLTLLRSRFRAPALLNFSRSFFALPKFFALFFALLQDRQNRTGRTGQAEQDRQNRTGRTGQAEQDR